MRGFVLAGTASGVGKTVATLTVIRAIERAGHAVQPAKAGPDFIDPSHHAAVAGRPSRTLDTWLSGPEGVRRNYRRGGGGVRVVEGVMGLYDGEVSSTASVAEALSLPVVLVVDASAGMESVAATALGFREYADRVGRDVEVAGVLASRASGGRHERGIHEALPDELAYFGRIPPLPGLEIPERHLGLHMGEESPVDGETLDEAAESVRAERLLDVAREPPRPAAEAAPGSSRDVRVAVARDDAFRFVYPATRERLRERATVVAFAPTAGDDLPDCDAVYLPGGYPELHADRLSASPALATLADRASEGLPVLGECGGLMALAESLTTAGDGPDAPDGAGGERVEADAGETYPMAGVLPVEVTMHDRFRALDHVELRARRGTLTAGAGGTLRGHEFHYSSGAVESDARFAFDVERGAGIDGDHDGLTEHRTLGTYAHVHATSGAFDRLVDSIET